MHTLRLLCAANNEEAWIRRQQRIIRRNEEVIAEMSEEEFVDRFGLDKGTFNKLCSDLRKLTFLKGTREIPLQIKVLVTLSFLATGSYQRIIGHTLHIVQRTASRCIEQVVESLNHPAMLNKWLKFPQSQQEITRLKHEFESKFCVPGVIGCVDCTHIAIVKPSEEENLFYNSKGYYSLNVQMVCDSDLKIMNVNPKFGGATLDSDIWELNRVETYLRELHDNGEEIWLLGVPGYPLRPWLLTPRSDATPGSPEDVHIQRRIRKNCVKRCFALLKSRWKCLEKTRTLHYHPVKAGRIVIACSVLHNMAIEAELLPPSTVELEKDI